MTDHHGGGSLYRRGLLVAPALLALFLIQGCKEESPPAPEVIRPIKMMVIESAAAARARPFPGVVRASQEVDLAFRVSGPLIEFPAKQQRLGDEIEQGALLAKIDPRDFETSLANVDAALQDLNAQLTAMEQGERVEDIRVLEAQVQVAQAEYDKTDADYARMKQLFDDDIISETEFERYETARNVAQAKLDAAQQQLARGDAARPEDIESMKARIRALDADRKSASDALDDTDLIAPFAGMVATTFVENFQTVQAQQPILSLQDVSIVEIVVQIPEQMVIAAPGDRSTGFEVTFLSLPGRSYTAEMKEYDTEADPQTQTYAVTVTMPQPDDANVLPGMTAEVLVTIAEPRSEIVGAFEAPASAVRADEEGRSYVWKIDPETMRVSEHEVTVGELFGANILILEGLAPGDTIATAGVHFLREGQQVRPLEDPGAAP